MIANYQRIQDVDAHQLLGSNGHLGCMLYMLQYVNPFPCHLFTSLAKMFTDVFLCVIFKLPHPLPPWQFGFQCLRWPIQRRICLRLPIKRRTNPILGRSLVYH